MTPLLFITDGEMSSVCRKQKNTCCSSFGSPPKTPSPPTSHQRNPLRNTFYSSTRSGPFQGSVLSATAHISNGSDSLADCDRRRSSDRKPKNNTRRQKTRLTTMIRNLIPHTHTHTRHAHLNITPVFLIILIIILTFIRF